MGVACRDIKARIEEGLPSVRACRTAAASRRRPAVHPPSSLRADPDGCAGGVGGEGGQARPPFFGPRFCFGRKAFRVVIIHVPLAFPPVPQPNPPSPAPRPCPARRTIRPAPRSAL